MYFRLLLLALLLTGCQPIVQQPPVEEPIPAPESEPPAPEPETIIEECPPPEVPEPCPVCPVCPVLNPLVEKPAAIKTSTPPNPITLGAIEKVLLDPPGITLDARIDTGAKSSSLHAENIIRFERDGERWISFDIPQENGELVNVKLPQERRVRIIQANEEYDRRFVVKMWLKIGNIREKVDVTLTDRSDLEYPLLVGRSFLLDTAVVDVSRKYTQR